MVLFDVVGHFYNFSRSFFVKKKSAFVETSCSPGDPTNDLQNVKNSPEPPTTVLSPKMGSKPTNLIRDDNIQSTATTCILCTNMCQLPLTKNRRPVVHSLSPSSTRRSTGEASRMICRALDLLCSPSAANMVCAWASPVAEP